MSKNDGKTDCETIYAWLCPDDEGIEGILTVPSPAGGRVTLVTTCLDNAHRAAMVAGTVASTTGHAATLYRFDRHPLPLGQIG